MVGERLKEIKLLKEENEHVKAELQVTGQWIGRKHTFEEVGWQTQDLLAFFDLFILQTSCPLG